MSPTSDPLTLKSHPWQRRHRFSKILFFDKYEVKNKTFTFKEKNFASPSFIINGAAIVGLVRTNHLPELSLAGECEGQGEHQEGSEGENYYNVVSFDWSVTSNSSHSPLCPAPATDRILASA